MYIKIRLIIGKSLLSSTFIIWNIKMYKKRKHEYNITKILQIKILHILQIISKTIK